MKQMEMLALYLYKVKAHGLCRTFIHNHEVLEDWYLDNQTIKASAL